MPHHSVSLPNFSCALPINFASSPIDLSVSTSKFSSFWPVSSSKESESYFWPKPALGSNPEFLWFIVVYLTKYPFTHPHWMPPAVRQPCRKTPVLIHSVPTGRTCHQPGRECSWGTVCQASHQADLPDPSPSGDICISWGQRNSTLIVTDCELVNMIGWVVPGFIVWFVLYLGYRLFGEYIYKFQFFKDPWRTYPYKLKLALSCSLFKKVLL